MPNRDGTGPTGRGKLKRRQFEGCRKQSTSSFSRFNRNRPEIGNKGIQAPKLGVSGETVLKSLTSLWGVAALLFSAWKRNRSLPEPKATKQLTKEEVIVIDTPKDS